MIRRLSLQTRLLVLLALLLAILWAGLEIATRGNARLQAIEDIDDELRTTLDLLLALERSTDIDPEGRRAILTAARGAAQGHFADPAYEVVSDGRLVVRSVSFPALSEPPPPGIANAQAGTETWRVLTIVDPEARTTRRAALSEAVRVERMRELTTELSTPWMIVLPIFAILILVSVWLGLRPLRKMEARLIAISPYDPEPLGLEVGRMPRELGTLARSFDDLVARLARVMSDQRIFAAAASHELRTPLAGALSQLDVLKRAPDRRESFDRLARALSHMERLVTQLLFLARSDTVAVADRPATIELAVLVREVGAELDLGDRLQVEGTGRMVGHPDLIWSLLRNLIRNAQQASGGVSVVIGGTPNAVEVAVLDRGPGIPEAEWKRVFEPFHRSRGGRGEGAGLGLTVAQRIAELHRGWIAVADRPGGGAMVIATLARRPERDGA